MRVCVVGNGPTANGYGPTIDACEHVIRLKAFWRFGAEDAGTRCTIWGHFGCPQVQAVWRRNDFGRIVTANAARWFLHTAEQLRKRDDLRERLEFLVESACGMPCVMAPQPVWQAVRNYLDCDPSSGFVAVAMAMALLEPDELVLAGFDATTEDKPNWENARVKQLPCDHSFIDEKRAFAEIAEGRWLGKSTQTRLRWLSQPEIDRKQFTVVIPARYQSCRLPGKPLIDLGGKPMIVRSWEAVRQDVPADRIIVATDDTRIMDACTAHGIERVEMTSGKCRTGTDRTAEIAARYADVECWVVAMGDNPFLPSGVIGPIVDGLMPGIDASMGRAPLTKEAAQRVTNHKAVIDDAEMLLYSSRCPIPYGAETYWDQVNVYAMWPKTLKRFAELPTGPSERTETLELHRLLEHGGRIRTVEVKPAGGHIDVPEDVEPAQDRFAEMEAVG